MIRDVVSARLSYLPIGTRRVSYCKEFMVYEGVESSSHNYQPLADGELQRIYNNLVQVDMSCIRVVTCVVE